MNLADMKAAAEKAIFLDWKEETQLAEYALGKESFVADRHIANCSPERILAMIAVCEAAKLDSETLIQSQAMQRATEALEATP